MKQSVQMRKLLARIEILNKTNKPPSPKAPRGRPIIAAPAMWMTFVEAAGPAVLALLSADVTSAADVDASALVEAGVGHRGDVAEEMAIADLSTAMDARRGSQRRRMIV